MAVECPEDGCGFASSSEQGFRIHYGRVHGPPYPFDRQADYPSKYYRQRDRVLERDDHACQECGAEPFSEGGTAVLHVHHIDGDKGNNEMTNLLTLCARCHGRVESEWGELAEE